MAISEEWLTSNTSIAYPFTVRPESVPNLYKLFVDACIVHSDREYDGRLELTRFKASGDSEVEIRRATGGQVVFAAVENDPGVDFQLVTMDAIWYVFTWRKAGDSVTLLCDAALLDATPALQVLLTPTDAEFVNRAVVERPLRVDTIEVLQADATLIDTVDGQVEVEEGYNVELADVELGLDQASIFQSPTTIVRPPRRIRVSAAPGGGAGRFPFCEAPEDLDLKTLAGVAPDQYGNLVLNAAGCMWWERPGVNSGPIFALEPQGSTPNQIRLHQDCFPCCECDDYFNLYDILILLYEQYKEAAQLVEDARLRLEEMVATWNALPDTECHLISNLILHPQTGWTVGVQLLFQNGRNCDLPDFSLDAPVHTVGGGGGAVSIVPGTRVVLLPTGETDVWDPSSGFSLSGGLRAGRFVGLMYQLYVGKPHDTATTVQVDVTGTAGGVPIALSQTVNLISPLNKD